MTSDVDLASVADPGLLYARHNSFMAATKKNSFAPHQLLRLSMAAVYIYLQVLT